MGRVTVGPCVNGSAGEVYELIEQLQSALFGGVYRARGLKSGRDYAVKVLHKRELSRIQNEARGDRNVEFCEMPLSEVTFAAKMRDNGYVLELMDRLMQVDPRKRSSVSRVVDHPWFTEKPSPVRWPAPSHLVVEEREMLQRMYARQAAATAVLVNSSAPSDDETAVENPGEQLYVNLASTRVARATGRVLDHRGGVMHEVVRVSKGALHRSVDQPSKAAQRSSHGAGMGEPCIGAEVDGTVPCPNGQRPEIE
ncbi:hypothetical protein Pmar_PMAR017998 [Perkinsus marinus ATCC 50983]|uniref:Protein kinase domain-containing protein n=1 Tax=Perkinsus marinus (strain ATCC 50983 / TXsc) TaxID=423536 RepID=C5LNC9_PERM5|nr:hypothetical protein Pmar_PMAR017998 [Perkinsus marinus ATCC 50983]EER01769.1 hypothetical protein Pmar_PMAR017998 [Perkinsus marinus ATCC 50983]|eukprot:XP_002769051.1 hypothetical protein Pmar_PMAR017998 [Perkinsus marinus ATCC 50983]